VKALVYLLLLVAFFWAFYTGAMAVRSYWQMSEVVEGALDRGARAGPIAVRDTILRGAAEAEVPLADSDVMVSEESRVLFVKLRWAWPVIAWQGEQIVQIPFSIERSYARP
jgi:hypothetical protein